MNRPSENDYASFYHKYILHIKSETLLDALEEQRIEIERLSQILSNVNPDYRYASGKWSVRQVLQHMIDCERVFAFRALWFARKHPAALEGFDENEFANLSDSKRSLQLMLDEINVVHASTRFLFQSFEQNELLRKGIASNWSVTVNAIGFIIAGHFKHHVQILQERYL